MDDVFGGSDNHCLSIHSLFQDIHFDKNLAFLASSSFSFANMTAITHHCQTMNFAVSYYIYIHVNAR